MNQLLDENRVRTYANLTTSYSTGNSNYGGKMPHQQSHQQHLGGMVMAPQNAHRMAPQGGMLPPPQVVTIQNPGPGYLMPPHMHPQYMVRSL